MQPAEAAGHIRAGLDVVAGGADYAVGKRLGGGEFILVDHTEGKARDGIGGLEILLIDKAVTDHLFGLVKFGLVLDIADDLSVIFHREGKCERIEISDDGDKQQRGNDRRGIVEQRKDDAKQWLETRPEYDGYLADKRDYAVFPGVLRFFDAQDAHLQLDSGRVEQRDLPAPEIEPAQLEAGPEAVPAVRKVVRKFDIAFGKKSSHAP